jgi:hypothetical protein
LVFVLLVSIGLSWFAVKLERARRQREAVEAIEGMVVVYYEGGYCPTDPFAEPSLPRWLRELFGYDFFFDVVEVYVSERDFGDEEASHLKALTSLTTLRLADTKISDAGLKHLEGLTNLEGLNLSGTQVTPEGVKKLKRALPACEIVY